jgi:putative membrane protein
LGCCFKNQATLLFSVPFSAVIGVSLTLLGVVVIIVALLNFLRIRTAIDAGTFHPPTSFAILLTVLTSLIGVLLAVYLLLTV